MISIYLAVDLQALFDKFGLHTDAFIAHAIGFCILVSVVVYFGIKPVAAQLEERRRRIEEGEAMRAESQRVLADVQATSDSLIREAHALGDDHVNQAKQTASRIADEASQKASSDAKAILENARKQAEFEAQQQKEALRAEFTRLLAEATSQVTGKVLTEHDHEVINAQAINQI